jgi:hypothetical protein
MPLEMVLPAEDPSVVALSAAGMAVVRLSTAGSATGFSDGLPAVLRRAADRPALVLAARTLSGVVLAARTLSGVVRSCVGAGLSSSRVNLPAVTVTARNTDARESTRHLAGPYGRPPSGPHIEHTEYRERADCVAPSSH